MAHDSHLTAEERSKARIKKIWTVAGILAIVTAVEYLIAFLLPFSKAILAVLFLVLTMVKAYYIVSEFMHLGHESKPLRWSVLFPLIFVIWLVVALLVEGGDVFPRALGRYMN